MERLDRWGKKTFCYNLQQARTHVGGSILLHKLGGSLTNFTGVTGIVKVAVSSLEHLGK